jgi:hypothetical protein
VSAVHLGFRGFDLDDSNGGEHQPHICRVRGTAVNRADWLPGCDGRRGSETRELTQTSCCSEWLRRLPHVSCLRLEGVPEERPGAARLSLGSYSLAATVLFPRRERAAALQSNKSSFRPPGVRMSRNSRRSTHVAKERRISPMR